MTAASPSGPRGAWPAVAVVVATRNRPELLGRAVGAILAQEYRGDIECLAVFDRSEPAAIQASTSARRRFRVLANTRTPGLAGARNSGMLAGAAPLVAFCDDDDVWSAGKVRRQVEALESAGAEFVAAGVRIHHGDHVVTRIPPPAVGLAQLVRERVGALHPSTFLFRRALLDEVGLIDEEIPGSYGEDYDWLLRAARRMPVRTVAAPLADVYWHRQSYFAQRWATVADALEYLLAKHPELMADAGGRARIQGQIAFAQAALARRPAAVRTGWRAIRSNPLERRAYLALAVASGAVSAPAIVRLANSRGRGI